MSVESDLCKKKSIEEIIMDLYRFRKITYEPITDCLLLEKLLRESGFSQQADEVKDQVRSKLLEIENNLNNIIKTIDPYPATEEDERACKECEAVLGKDVVICPECGAENPLDDGEQNA